MGGFRHKPLPLQEKKNEKLHGNPKTSRKFGKFVSFTKIINLTKIINPKNSESFRESQLSGNPG
jgi:hypothetical protein